MKDTLEFSDDQLNTAWRVLAAVLNAGELRVTDQKQDGETSFEDPGLVANGEYRIPRGEEFKF